MKLGSIVQNARHETRGAHVPLEAKWNETLRRDCSFQCSPLLIEQACRPKPLSKELLSERRFGVQVGAPG